MHLDSAYKRWFGTRRDRIYDDSTPTPNAYMHPFIRQHLQTVLARAAHHNEVPVKCLPHYFQTIRSKMKTGTIDTRITLNWIRSQILRARTWCCTRHSHNYCPREFNYKKTNRNKQKRRKLEEGRNNCKIVNPSGLQSQEKKEMKTEMRWCETITEQLR